MKSDSQNSFLWQYMDNVRGMNHLVRDKGKVSMCKKHSVSFICSDSCMHVMHRAFSNASNSAALHKMAWCLTHQTIFSRRVSPRRSTISVGTSKRGCMRSPGRGDVGPRIAGSVPTYLAKDDFLLAATIVLLVMQNAHYVKRFKVGSSWR